VLGTIKPKANQVRGCRTKESFRDYLGNHVIIHRMPDDHGKSSTPCFALVLCFSTVSMLFGGLAMLDLLRDDGNHFGGSFRSITTISRPKRKSSADVDIIEFQIFCLVDSIA
jgi:hypothetical protein